MINFNLRQEFLSVIIHSADVSNPTKPMDIYKQWAHRCVDEFFKQGDMEKRLGIPVSFNCDRDTVSLPQSQLGFMDAIVSPLFSVVCEFFPGMNFTLDNLKKNREHFKEEREKEIKHIDKEEIKEDKEMEDSDKDEQSNSNSDKEIKNNDDKNSISLKEE